MFRAFFYNGFKPEITGTGFIDDLRNLFYIDGTIKIFVLLNRNIISSFIQVLT